tara:strand:+ start:21 stop:200 length:180 start_codon:yes stop_codon:yes gene_type:complete
MALSNAEVLSNLKEQRTQLEKDIELTRTTYLKVLGAIDVLEQIEESNAEETISEEDIRN